MTLICSVCGGRSFIRRQVLWRGLVDEWGLSDEEADYIDRQQGECCTNCGSSLRSIALASALCETFVTSGTLKDFVASKDAARLRILELNEAGHLHDILKQMPGHVLGVYPDIDMLALPFSDGEFDVVVHSDTLEHVPDPIRALSECRRVLNPNGSLCFTVPIVVGRMTRDRSGLPRSFHGDPTKNMDDYVVHTEFGADAWTYTMKAGFTDVQIFTTAYPAAHALKASTKLERLALHSSENLVPPEAAAPNEDNGDALSATGERYVPELLGEIRQEHLHRYALCRDLVKGRDVLDIASGEGFGSVMLAEQARSVIGIDVADDAVRHAVRRYGGQENLRFLQSNAIGLPLDDASVDVVCSFETIEHVSDQTAMLSEIARVLRPDGFLIISSPNVDIYTVKQAHNNPFHVRELNKTEFLELVRSKFPACELLHQRQIVCSSILKEDHTSEPATVYKDADRIQRDASKIGSTMYFVAIASRSETYLPDLSPSFLIGGERDVYWELQPNAKSHADLNDLQNRFEALDAHALELTKHAKNLEDERDDLRCHASNLAERVNDLTQHTENLQAERNSLYEAIEAERSSIEQIHSTVRNAYLLAFESESARIKDELAGEIARRKAIEDSTIWAASAPLRALVRLFKG